MLWFFCNNGGDTIKVEIEEWDRKKKKNLLIKWNRLLACVDVMCVMVCFWKKSRIFFVKYVSLIGIGKTGKQYELVGWKRDREKERVGFYHYLSSGRSVAIYILLFFIILSLLL